MSFFKNLFRRKEVQSQPAPPDLENITFPASIPVIPGKLTVHVFQHTIHLREGSFESLAYTTEGMTKVGQPELTLVVRNQEQQYAFHPDPVHLFKGIYTFVEQGTRLDKGSTAYLDNKPMFGWPGILYTQFASLPDKRFPADALSLILVSKEELEMAKNLGLTRVLTLLGAANSFYPHPYWSDIDRSTLPVEQITNKSLLSRITCIQMRLGHVTRSNRTLTFVVPRALPSNYFTFSELPPVHPVAFLPALNPDANGCLVWTWDGQPSAITPSDGDGSRMGGCMLILFGKQETVTIRLIEDGFGIGMPDDKWNELWDSLLHTRKEVFLEDMVDTMKFKLVWE